MMGDPWPELLEAETDFHHHSSSSARVMDSSMPPTETGSSVSPTQIDSDSDDQFRVPLHSDDPGPDSLLDALDRPIEEEESWDSQLTEDEHPNQPLAARLIESGASAAAPGVHWSRTEDFIDGVRQILDKAAASGARWFRIAPCFDVMDLMDFEGCVNHAIQWIKENRDHWGQYKIGITECPLHRWYNDDHGYAHATENVWSAMHIVYIAPTSKWKRHIVDTPESLALKMASTGAMERALIREFKGTQGCINVADGGDCPSTGSPHLVYVITEAF